MLQKSPLTRLWKFNQIKQDPWFSKFDWDGLISFSLPPAYKTSVDKASNPQNIKGVPYLTYIKSKTINDSRFINPNSQQKRVSDFDHWVMNF